MHRAALHDVRRRMDADGSVELVVLDEAGVGSVAVGAVEVSHESGVPTLTMLEVRPEHRGRGIGTALVRELEDRLRRRGWSWARLGVEQSNPDARRLYERLGYRVVGVEVDGWDELRADGTIGRYETTLDVLVHDLGEPTHGPWDPMPIDEVVALLDGAPFRWWVAGGQALELHAGRSWRAHADLDVGICRTDAPALQSWASRMDLHIAADGRLTPWRTQAIGEDEGNVWCRTEPDGPWRLDVLVGDGSDHEWIYRRDRSVRLPWDRAVRRTVDGIPYLAPEVQLLFKSRGLRAKDTADAEIVAPSLDVGRRRWLAGVLDPTHPWHALLA